MKQPLAVLLFICALEAFAQTAPPNANRFETWLPYQFIPSLTLFSSPGSTAFGLEWEAAPLLYSFGMNPHVSRWYSFLVEPTARFAGSVELSVAGQFYPAKIGSSNFTYSTQLMSSFPLAEHGEHLTLNLGVAAHRYDRLTRVFGVGGVSTAFGILHLNVKYSPSPSTLIGSVEFRIF